MIFEGLVACNTDIGFLQSTFLDTSKRNVLYIHYNGTEKSLEQKSQ